MRLAAVFLFAAGVSACAFPSPAVVVPAGDSQGAALVVRMTLRGRDYINRMPRHAPVVYFAQKGRDGALMRDNLVRADLRAGSYVIALDVPPGRYSPVAAAFPRGSVRAVAKLPEALSEQWTVEARPGLMTFAGDATLIPPEGLDWRALLRFKDASALAFTSPKLEKTANLELPALRAARAKLKGTTWVELIDRRLKELGNPPEPYRVGHLFKKTIAPTREGRFGYIDTLGWGKPRKVPGGLLWKASRDRARVDVRFLQADATGYVPADLFLRQLREAGSPEDEHALFNVELASRTARAARFTTYRYPQAALTGSELKVFVTETLCVVDKDGYYLVRLEAPRAEFFRRHAPFRRFASYLVFLPPEKPE